MSRALLSRIERLERIRPPHPATPSAILEAAQAIRAGGTMPATWKALWTPGQILRAADEIERTA